MSGAAYWCKYVPLSKQATPFAPRWAYGSTMDIALEISNARRIAGYSVRHLATLAGVTHTQVMRVERGESDPSFGTAQRLLNACGRHIVIADGLVQTSRLLPGALPLEESLRRHGEDIERLADDLGCARVRVVPPALLREVMRQTGHPTEGDSDVPVVFLVSVAEDVMGAKVVLTQDLERLLGCRVEVLEDHQLSPEFAHLTRVAVPVTASSQITS